MREIHFAVDKAAEQFQSIEVKKGVKADSQLLKLFVIAKRLGVTNDLMIPIIAYHFKRFDRFYVDRLLPLIAQNPKTKVLEQVYVDNSRGDSGSLLVVNEISDKGLCSPSQSMVLGDYGGDKDLRERISYLLSLLGY